GLERPAHPPGRAGRGAARPRAAARRRRRGVPHRDERPGRRPARYRRLLARRGAGRPGIGGGLPRRPGGLRREAARLPGAAVPAGRDGDRAGGGARPAVAGRRRTGRRGAAGHPAVRDGQAAGHRDRVLRRRPRPAAARRLRLPHRVRHREDRPRPAGAPDPGRDQRDHEPHRRPRPHRGRVMSAPTDRADGPDVLLHRDGRAGRAVLNRPRALNALTHAMVGDLDAALTDWEHDDEVAAVVLTGAGERGLCAGGDIRSIYEDARCVRTGTREFWRDEYRLNARIAGYPKSYVAVMDGIVIGGGVGVSAHAGVRVVTERSRIAIPETGIRFVPDVGGTWLLSRAPGELGTHLALTAAPAGAGDAIRCGLADHYVPADRLPGFTAALARSTPEE